MAKGFSEAQLNFQNVWNPSMWNINIALSNPFDNNYVNV